MLVDGCASTAAIAANVVRNAILSSRKAASPHRSPGRTNRRASPFSPQRPSLCSKRSR
ncbi:MAG: hypothetical protein R3F11_31955 [Verrucomicrobiales bacterium]